MVTKVEDTPKISERVRLEREELASATPHIDIDRTRIQLEVYKETEGQPSVIRRAKLFHRLCTEKPIYIDNNPIVGTLTKHKYGAYLYPEEGCRWMKKTDKFALQRGVTTVTDEETRRLIDEAVDYWKDRNVFNRTKTIVEESLGVDIAALSKAGLGTEITPGGGVTGGVPDFPMILNRGLNGILEDVHDEMQDLDIGGPDGLDKWHFYQAVILSLNGMIALAQRYASLAREMAIKASDASRRRELERIAETCEWVPANPARNFYEAMQSLWFIRIGIWLGSGQALQCPPSGFTQYMYPLYRKDKAEGKLTDEDVIELLQMYFLKINQLAATMPPHGFAFNQSRLGMQLRLGGVTPDGEDATNELDLLILEAQCQLRMPEPLVQVLYHDRLSQEFLLKCVDLIRTGIGQPAFHNLEIAIKRHLYHHKMSLEEARQVDISGCVQSSLPGYTDGSWESRFNLAKVFELTINNGIDPRTGIQIGPQTGALEHFKTFDEFQKAFNEQLKTSMRLIRTISRIAWNVTRDLPRPFNSALVHDCIKKGRDLADGGSRYNWADGLCFIGGIDAANSLTAMKNLVFEGEKCSIEQLKKALDANFEGCEDIEQMCLNAPKYGNDDEYGDAIARELYRLCDEYHQEFPDYLGRPTLPAAYSVTAHYALGRFTGALPNGRKAEEPLTDASVSAQPGTDKNGPTALVKSAAKVLDCVRYGSSHFNIKFHPSALRDADGARKLLSLIKTYFDLGGYHVQFNCVSSETLRDAQLHPENYQNLVVRVAGFSAYFIHLDKAMQNEIIKRTEITF